LVQVLEEANKYIIEANKKHGVDGWHLIDISAFVTASREASPYWKRIQENAGDEEVRLKLKAIDANLQKFNQEHGYLSKWKIDLPNWPPTPKPTKAREPSTSQPSSPKPTAESSNQRGASPVPRSPKKRGEQRQNRNQLIRINSFHLRKRRAMSSTKAFKKRYQNGGVLQLETLSATNSFCEQIENMV
jgi:hypothetical protein